MHIEREKYDQLPFAIQLGALHLWGTRLTTYQQADQYYHLYRFNDFLAEVKHTNDQQPRCIRTYPNAVI